MCLRDRCHLDEDPFYIRTASSLVRGSMCTTVLNCEDGAIDAMEWIEDKFACKYSSQIQSIASRFKANEQKYGRRFKQLMAHRQEVRLGVEHSSQDLPLAYVSENIQQALALFTTDGQDWIILTFRFTLPTPHVQSIALSPSQYLVLVSLFSMFMDEEYPFPLELRPLSPKTFWTGFELLQRFIAVYEGISKIPRYVTLKHSRHIGSDSTRPTASHMQLREAIYILNREFILAPDETANAPPLSFKLNDETPNCEFKFSEDGSRFHITMTVHEKIDIASPVVPLTTPSTAGEDIDEYLPVLDPFLIWNNNMSKAEIVDFGITLYRHLPFDLQFEILKVGNFSRLYLPLPEKNALHYETKFISKTSPLDFYVRIGDLKNVKRITTTKDKKPIALTTTIIDMDVRISPESGSDTLVNIRDILSSFETH